MHPGHANQSTAQLRRKVVDAISRRPAIGLAELSITTELSESTVAEIAAELERDGWLASSIALDANLGHAKPSYALVSNAAFCLGVDLGGTKVAAAISDLRGNILGEMTEPTESRGERHIFDQITRLAAKLAVSADVDVGKVKSVLVGIPGAVEPSTGKISLVPNIQAIADFDLLQRLRHRYGPVTFLENDANLAACGEVAQGHAQGARHCAFLAIGTGIGLGVIVDGKLVRGATGAAGEIGYLPIGEDTTSLEALSTGAFELEAGSIAIVQRYRTAGGDPVATVRDVFRLAEEGDEIAKSVLDTTAHSIALAITALQAILDLEIIVLGGSIGVRTELLARVQREIVKVFSRPVKIVTSQLGSRAGLIGALRGAHGRLYDEYFGGSVGATDFVML